MLGQQTVVTIGTARAAMSVRNWRKHAGFVRPAGGPERWLDEIDLSVEICDPANELSLDPHNLSNCLLALIGKLVPTAELEGAREEADRITKWAFDEKQRILCDARVEAEKTKKRVGKEIRQTELARVAKEFKERDPVVEALCQQIEEMEEELKDREQDVKVLKKRLGTETEEEAGWSLGEVAASRYHSLGLPAGARVTHVDGSELPETTSGERMTFTVGYPLLEADEYPLLAVEYEE